MAEASFSHAIVIREQPSQVHSFFADLHNSRALHPLIEEIRDLPASPEQPGARRYRVVDRIAVGPLRFRTAYTAALEVRSPNEIRGTAWQFPGIEVHTRFLTEPHAEGTQLSETATIRAPFLLLWFAHAQAREAHRQMLQNLKAHLEQSSRVVPEP